MQQSTLRLFVICLMLASTIGAKETKGLNLTLISENKSIQAGQPFTIGLHIQHHKGYHTYWQNPGVVGVPTNLSWTLPDGFTASAIRWPYPEQSVMADYPCHGYERDVTLLVTITPPKTFTKKQFTLTAKVSWMCCAMNCQLGFKTLAITLPVGAKSEVNSIYQLKFSKARKELPRSSAGIKCKLLSSAQQDVINLSFTLPVQQKPIYLFSSDGQLSSDQKQTFKLQQDGSYLLSIKRSKSPLKGTTSLPGVLKTNLGCVLVEPKYK